MSDEPTTTNSHHASSSPTVDAALTALATCLDEVVHRLASIENCTTSSNFPPPPPPPPYPPGFPPGFLLAVALGHSLRLDVPRFDGSDPMGWLFKISQFFDFHHTPLDQRITIASFYLDGEALAWYQWMHANQQLTSWPQFIMAV